jgi:hypothetical protein
LVVRVITACRAADVLDAADHTDEGFGLVVIRGEIGVADWPVEAEAVARSRLEVVVREAQRDASVMVRAAAENA